MFHIQSGFQNWFEFKLLFNHSEFRFRQLQARTFKSDVKSSISITFNNVVHYNRPFSQPTGVLEEAIKLVVWQKFQNLKS